MYGSRTLAVRGRRSGQWRTTPVNPLEFRGQRYIVAPRGVTDWVRNIRASGEGELWLGSRREPIKVVELSDAEKPEILREYLRKWAWEVGAFFEGVGADASDADIQAAAQAPHLPRPSYAWLFFFFFLSFFISWGSLNAPRLGIPADGGGTTGPMSPSGASSRSTITGA